MAKTMRYVTRNKLGKTWRVLLPYRAKDPSELRDPVKRKEKPKPVYFSDAKYGTEKKSLAAAIKYRDAAFAKAGVSVEARTKLTWKMTDRGTTLNVRKITKIELGVVIESAFRGSWQMTNPEWLHWWQQSPAPKYTAPKRLITKVVYRSALRHGDEAAKRAVEKLVTAGIKSEAKLQRAIERRTKAL